MAASLLSLLVLGSSIPFANADAFDAGKTADAIYQAAQQSSVQQHQATPSQPATSTPSTGSSSAGNSGYSGSSNSGYSGGSSYSGDSSSGLSDNSGDDDDDDWMPKSQHNSSNSNTDSDDDDDTPSESHHHRDSHHEDSGMSDKQKAALKAERYLEKVREKLALKVAKNNDGGAWVLRHSYENQLQVIKNGSKTAQTRALQVQLSGELNQLQAAHDNRVKVFNQEIDKLPNSHRTDLQAVNLQDSIDYEDAKLARKQAVVRKKYAKQIRAINPVNRQKAMKQAKKAYYRQLKDKGLVDPYKLQKQNRHAWKHAQAVADEMREDY